MIICEQALKQIKLVSIVLIIFVGEFDNACL